MARRKHSPRLELAVTQEQYDRAVRSNSGACLISDAIKAQYPELTNISSDMATVRVTDRKRGERYIYMTPPAAQHLLLAFDQGWPNPTDRLTIKGAVQIHPITRSRLSAIGRAERVAELQRKEAAGEPLTRYERAALTRMAGPNGGADRPTARGPAKVTVDRGRVTVRGGAPRMQGPAHPNLLRSANRHFGAKLADPGIAFREAVEAAVEERLGGQQPVPESAGS
jgi:hypothetical protein